MNGEMICPNCKTRITRESQYVFLDVNEEFGTGRDVITFDCHACGKVGKSYVFKGAPRGETD